MTITTQINQETTSNVLKSSRAAALAAGDSHYLGKGCPHRHYAGQIGDTTEPASLRTTHNKQCTECTRLHRVGTQPFNGTRRSTKTKGATFEGNPCRYQHSGTRYVSNRKCVECTHFDNVARKPDWYRERSLAGRYGITLDDYARILSDQFGSCGICGKFAFSKLDVDHCHKSGTVRGLLCHSCNVRLGSLREDPARLEPAAVAYLARSEARLAA